MGVGAIASYNVATFAFYMYSYVATNDLLDISMCQSQLPADHSHDCGSVECG